MKSFAVIGNPVEHSLSPLLHHWVFGQLHIDASYSKLHVTKNQIPHVISKLRDGKLDGINITLPHKSAIIPFLDELNIRANQMMAVNCLTINDEKLMGYNTDWFGFRMLLQENNIDIDEKTFLILGAGGVAKSVLYTLIQLDAGKITISNRTQDHAEQLISSMQQMAESTELKIIPLENIENHLKNNTIVINCTSIGLKPLVDASPLSKHIIHGELILIDTIYAPLKTRFLKFGEEAGAATINGLDMFIHQGLASLDIWFGKPYSQQVDNSALKHYLEDKIMNENKS
tara:strand:+ start:4618 stop:5478 length:861 start_codon:yes stop_codon:yes gene_type:complete